MEKSHGIADVNNTGVLLYNDVSDGELLYVRIVKYVAPLFMLFVAFVLVTSCVSYYRRPRKDRDVIRWILLSSFFSLWTQTSSYMHMTLNWEDRVSTCHYTPGIGTCPYILANTCMYIFLHARAKAATKADKDPVLAKFLKVLLAVTICSPLLCVLAVVFVDGYVLRLANGVIDPMFLCGFVLPLWAALLFLVLDTSLSLGYLVVFILPVYRIIKRTRELAAQNSHEKTMNKLVRQNLRASSIAISSTFILMTLLSYGYWKVGDGTSNLVFVTWTFPLSLVDVAVNVFAMTSITTIWIPPGWRLMPGLLLKRDTSPMHSSGMTPREGPNHEQQQKKQQKRILPQNQQESSQLSLNLSNRAQVGTFSEL